jgi:murein DD-endopeptidase MepM/ murein hydrolase activator NlpD
MLKLALAGAAALAGFLLVFVVVLSAVAPAGAAGRAGEFAPSTVALQDICGAGVADCALLDTYRAAARTCPGLDWTVLAGVGKVESDHGRSQAPGVHSGANGAGAMGPMQFLPATWDAFQTPAPSHVLADVYDLADAVYTAARYLCHLGAGTADTSRLRAALFGYNHSQAYVDQVLAVAASYRGPLVAGGAPTSVQPGDPLEGCAHPPVTQAFGPTELVGEPALFGFPHFHTGIDLACPYGTPVRDVGGPGVAHVQFGDTGFGNNVVVEVATAKGTYFVRYAHLAAIAVADGAQVAIDDLLGWEGSTGFSTGAHLHFETDLGSASVSAAQDPSGWLTL